MAKKYRKIQPKLKPLPFVIMGVIIVLFIVFLVLMTPTAKQKISNTYNSRGADLPKDHVFVEMNYKTYEKKLKDKENFVVYIGHPDCQACISEIKYYDTYFKDAGLTDNLKTIYYLNSTKLTAQQAKDLATRLSAEELKTPQLLYYHNGALTFNRSDAKYSEFSEKAPGQIKQFLLDVAGKQ